MKAMILAAGLGTRLRPITDNIPKALAPVNGVPMLEIIIKKLINAGCDEIIVNVHHFADKVIAFLNANNNFGIHIEISDERDQILDTGGGLKKASHFFDDGKPFFLLNVDVLCSTGLNTLYNYHCEQQNLATLLVRERPGSRFFLFDENKRLCGWTNTQTNEFKWPGSVVDNAQKLAFSTIHVIDPKIFELMVEEGVFSIVDVYLRLCPHYKIEGYLDNEGYWIDIGTPEKLQQAAEIIAQKG